MNLSAAITAPLQDILESLLVWIHHTFSIPWAWSIIVLTCVVRLIIFPLTAKQTRSSLAMQRLAPYQKQLQAKYKDDRAALNQAVMEFYRDNKVNPLASCLPLLVQLPVFLALFFMLRGFEPPTGTSTDFSFLGPFIHDIRQFISNDNPSTSIPKNWILAGPALLVVYVASQMLSTKTMMTSPNPQQKILFMLLPLFFAPMTWFWGFSVGVMLYWITTNLWSLGQYLVIVRFTDVNKEVVLPADSKGRKKVVGGVTAKSTPTGASKPAPRRNKRRK